MNTFNTALHAANAVIKAGDRFAARGPVSYQVAAGAASFAVAGVVFAGFLTIVNAPAMARGTYRGARKGATTIYAKARNVPAMLPSFGKKDTPDAAPEATAA